MIRILNAIRSIDILAPDIKLNINGKSSVKTLPGSFLSLLYVGMFSYLAMLHAIDYFDTTTPMTLSQLSKDGEYAKIDIVKDKHIPMVYLLDEFGTIVKYEDIFSYLTPTLLVDGWLPLGQGSDESIHNYHVVPSKKCGDLRKAGTFDLDYMNGIGGYGELLDDYGVCFDTTGIDTNIQGSFADLPNSFMTLYLAPCALQDKTLCKEHSVIAKSSIQIMQLESSVNFSDKKKPVKYSINSDFITLINPAISTFMQKSLINHKIVDKAGFLFPDKLVEEYTQATTLFPSFGWRNESVLHCTFEEVLTYACNPYLTITIVTSNTHVTYDRHYKGLLETLGEIGGLKDLILLACSCFYAFYHDVASRQVLVQSVYRLKTRNRCSLGKAAMPMSTAKRQPSDGCLEVGRQEEDRAWREVEATLDVVSLAKQMAVLKFIVESILDQSQRDALPTALVLAAKERVDLRGNFLKEKVIWSKSNISLEKMTNEAENSPYTGRPIKRDDPNVLFTPHTPQLIGKEISQADQLSPSLDDVIGRCLKRLAPDTGFSIERIESKSSPTFKTLWPPKKNISVPMIRLKSNKIEQKPK